MKLKTAIVTTLRDPGQDLVFFLQYHFAIGFDHIFLFFDGDEDDPMIEYARRFEGVSIRTKGDGLRRDWENSRSFKKNHQYAGFLDKEVMARQILNAELAINKCLDLGIDWIVHIDHDELFVLNKGSLAEHFFELDAANIETVRYLNHEAIPEKLIVGSLFEEVSLFKKNYAALNHNQVRYVNGLPNTSHFLYYTEGKSAARVSMNLLPADVHGFSSTNKVNICHDACVLHYPICGLNNFIKKYKILGMFEDKWFGALDINTRLPFHIQSRNIVNGNDEQLIRDFYIQKVMRKEQEIDTGLLQGIYFRNFTPVNLLKQDRVTTII